MQSTFISRMLDALYKTPYFQARVTRQYFDEAFYRACNPDVVDAGVDLFAHFLEAGTQEGRRPNPAFNVVWYLSTYPDALASDLGPIVFHHRYGRHRGYATAPTAENSAWLMQAEQNTRLGKLLREYAAHYRAIVETGLFEPDYYKATYGIDDSDPVDFFLRFGVHRGHNPSSRFDADAYIDANRDVRLARMNPFLHFARFGRSEGRPLRRAAKFSHDPLFIDRTPEEQRKDREAGERLAETGPLISIVVPVYNSDLDLLDICIGSILGSAYPKIELILVDDCSPKPGIREHLESWAARDKRVVVCLQPKNGNISRATNAGVDISKGSILVFVDHDDEISTDAILAIAQAAEAEPDVDAWYSDQVKCDAQGEVIDHFFKPDWSPYYLLGVMYVGHILAVKAELVRKVGGFDSQFDGVQDFEFMLRVSEHAQKIRHIPRALYKWRAISGSLAAGVNEKDFISERQVAGVQAHLARKGRSWTAAAHPRLPHRVVLEPGPRSATPSVSIIIPSKDQGEVVRRCLKSIHELTDYPDFEVIVVDNGSTDPVALQAFSEFPIKRIDYAKRFNFSEACNLGAASSSGELLVFLNNDTEVLDADWLRIMAMYFEDSDVGAVGPVLLYPDRRVQHAGIVLGARGTADHVMRFQPEGGDGYAGSLACTREVSGVTAACLMMPRDLFERVGTFSMDFAKHYQDVDLCLKILEAGKKILSIGNTQLLHYESLSRKEEGYDLGDRAVLIDRWHEIIVAGDPYYNAAFDLGQLNYGLR